MQQSMGMGGGMTPTSMMGDTGNSTSSFDPMHHYMQYQMMDKMMDGSAGPFYGPFKLQSKHVPLYNAHCNAVKDLYQCDQFVFCSYNSATASCKLDKSRVVVQHRAEESASVKSSIPISQSTDAQ